MDGASRAAMQNKRVMRKPKAVRGAASIAARRKAPASSSIGQKKKVQVVEPMSHSGAASAATDARKVAEVERKLGAMVVHKERLKERTDKLSGELNRTKVELNLTQQERGRMQQFWRIAESGLEEERERTREVERSMIRMKREQAEHVQRLQQKCRSLVYYAKMHRHAGTETEPIAPGGPLRSVESQTMEELTKEKAASILRQSDDLLVAFIAELEKEKLEAQSDLKYAIVHLEQRMKEEQEAQVRTMREEREIEIEEIGLKHMEQVRTIESANQEHVAMLEGKVDFLQGEVSNLRDLRDSISSDLVDAREKLTDQALILGQQKASIDEMSKEIERLQEYKRNFQRDMRNVDNMRKEVEKYKEINEIVMGEFAKIEKERDDLLVAVEKSLGNLEIESRMRLEKIEKNRNK